MYAITKPLTTGGGDGMRDARSTILKRRTDGDSLKRRRRGYSSDRYHGNSDAAYTSDSDNVDYNNYPRYIIDFLGKRVLANSSMQMSNVSIKKEPLVWCPLVKLDWKIGEL